jgi:hypothetical protein
MHQQLWGYKVEEKLYVGVREQKRLNTAGLRLPDLKTSAHKGRLSALRTGRLYPPRKYCRYSFLLHAGRTMSMKNSNDTIGNRTRDLPACSQDNCATANPKVRLLLCKISRNSQRPLVIICMYVFSKETYPHTGRQR